jgi:chemotaxis protein histidine kinase CheA
MSNASSEMIEQFAIETQEHLDAIEPILPHAEWTPPAKPAIAALFRAFHSIKGLSRLIELRGLETLANHAESLLGEVRAERQPLDAKVLALLLDALDGIRRLREQGIVNGVDAQPNRDLITALDAATRGSAGGDGAVAAAPPAPAASAEAVLHDDHDTLGYFAEMLEPFELADVPPSVASVS